MNKIIIILILIGAGIGGFWYYGQQNGLVHVGGAEHNVGESSQAVSSDNSPKGAAMTERTKANELLAKCRELDDSDRGIRRRIAAIESKLSLADAFYTAGDFATAKEAYEVVIDGCEKTLKAGETLVEAAKAKIRAQYLEADRAEMKKMKMASKDEIETSDMLVQAAIKDGCDAGDLLMKAESAEFASERYAFLRGAFRLSVKEKDGSNAADAVRGLLDGFEKNDFAAIVEMVESEAKDLLEAGNKEIQTALKLANLRLAADQLRKEARKTLKKNPEDHALRQRVAEALVILGEWESARKQFEKLGGAYAAAFADEAEEEKLFAAAEFWWNCEQKGELNVKPFYRNRAISLYKQMLGKNKGSEGEKAIAEKRIAEKLLGK